MSLALVPADTAGRHAVIEGDVLADLRSFTNDHAHAVIDEKAPPDARARMNLDASEPARQIRVEARQPLQLMRPQPVRSEEHTSELQSLMSHQYADYWWKKKKTKYQH